MIATKEMSLPRVFCSGESVSIWSRIQGCSLSQPGKIPSPKFRPLQLGRLPCPQPLTTDRATRSGDQRNTRKERGPDAEESWALSWEQKKPNGGEDRSWWEARLPFASPLFKLLSPEISKSSNKKEKKNKWFYFFKFICEVLLKLENCNGILFCWLFSTKTIHFVL